MCQLVRPAREALEKADAEAGDSLASAQRVMIECTRAMCCELAELYIVLDAIKSTIQFASGRPREIALQLKRDV